MTSRLTAAVLARGFIACGMEPHGQVRRHEHPPEAVALPFRGRWRNLIPDVWPSEPGTGLGTFTDMV